MGIKICDPCGVIFMGDFCNHCGQPDTESESVILGNKPLTNKTEEVVDHFIGPLDDPCKKCLKKEVKFSMVAPASTDEPFITTYLCGNCGFTYTKYK